MQIVRDVHRKGVLDRPVEEEEPPGEGDQTEQAVSAKRPKAGLDGTGIGRRRRLRGLGMRPPGPESEECERRCIEREQPCRRDPSKEHPGECRSDDRREPHLCAGERVRRQTPVVSSELSDTTTKPRNVARSTQ